MVEHGPDGNNLQNKKINENYMFKFNVDQIVTVLTHSFFQTPIHKRPSGLVDPRE